MVKAELPKRGFLNTSFVSGFKSCWCSFCRKDGSLPEGSRDSSSSKAKIPSFPSITSIQGWLSEKSMKVQLISSRTYSSCSSLKTWALNWRNDVKIVRKSYRYAHLLLQLFVRIVYTELLKRVLCETFVINMLYRFSQCRTHLLKVFESIDIQNADKHLCFARGFSAFSC